MQNKLDMVVYDYDPRAGEMETGGSLDSLANQPSLLVSVRPMRASSYATSSSHIQEDSTWATTPKQQKPNPLVYTQA